MTDRELLEAAAKAAGMAVEFDDEGCCLHRGTEWMPLTDDGDALRLAVKLELKIDWGAFDVVVTEFNSDSLGREPKGDDPCSSTRRAIVRAAAEIGRAQA